MINRWRVVERQSPIGHHHPDQHPGDRFRHRPADKARFGIEAIGIAFGHHFAAIAGAGPLVGPVLAIQMGYLPGTIWILLGAVFAGCVQDYLVLSISTRRRGRSLGQMARDELGPIGGAAAIIGVLVIMVILLAVLALVVVNALAESPWGVFSIAMTIPIAVFMGLYLRVFRPGRVTEVSLIGVVLLLAAVVAGGWVAGTDWGAEWFTLSKTTLSWCIIIYGLAASVLPVWFLLAPRDYLSTFMKIGTIALLAIGILVAHPVMQAPAVSKFAEAGNGPVFAGSLFPFLFITIACGALSGFHSLIASGTTPKLLEKEGQMRIIGYGGMLTESFVAIMALITASILDQHLYFAINSPAAATGGTAETAATAQRQAHLGQFHPGTIAAGDRLKDEYGTKIVAVEALECPTMLENGFGEHNIQGIGDKHIPLIHNVTNTDVVVAISDRATDELDVLFNTAAGRDYLVDRKGVSVELVDTLEHFGFSAICNVLAAISGAKVLGLGPDDVVVTVATDGAAMYGTELERIVAIEGLSKNVYELATRALT